MLKGLIIQASHTEALEAALTASGLPWRKVPGGSGKAISKASGSLGEPKELLCLVETDAEEKAALEQGFFCIGYLNPDLPGQKLSGCRILLEGFEEDPTKIWSSNIFGKSLHELVGEGLHNKLSKMPMDARLKLQETLQRIINEGCSGLICFIL